MIKVGKKVRILAGRTILAAKGEKYVRKGTLGTIVKIGRGSMAPKSSPLRYLINFKVGKWEGASWYGRHWFESV